MKNSLNDLHNILMEQLERLNDLTDKDGNDLPADLVDREFKRAKAISGTAATVVSLNSLVLDAYKTSNPDSNKLPKQFPVIEG